MTWKPMSNRTRRNRQNADIAWLKALKAQQDRYNAALKPLSPAEIEEYGDGLATAPRLNPDGTLTTEVR